MSRGSEREAEAGKAGAVEWCAEARKSPKFAPGGIECHSNPSARECTPFARFCTHAVRAGVSGFWALAWAVLWVTGWMMAMPGIVLSYAGMTLVDVAEWCGKRAKRNEEIR